MSCPLKSSCSAIGSTVCLNSCAEKGFWTNQRCASFIPKPDNSAIITNSAVVKPDTWNILEFKVNVVLLKEGYLTFTYKKISKQSLGFRNGRFRLDMGYRNALHDDNVTNNGYQTYHTFLPQGIHELSLYYAFNTVGGGKEFAAEISVEYKLKTVDVRDIPGVEHAPGLHVMQVWNESSRVFKVRALSTQLIS